MKSPPFTELEGRFVSQLEKLVADEDRATLAQLRRGLGKPLGFVTERDGWVLKRTPEISQPEDHRKLAIFAMVASLFALHSKPGGSGSFGEAFRELGLRAPASDGSPNPSVEKRFVALLNSNSEELGDRLRHAVSLLRANDIDIAIDWRRLLHDAQWWDAPRRGVQINWSRDFWGSRRPTDQTTEGELVFEPAEVATA